MELVPADPDNDPNFLIDLPDTLVDDTQIRKIPKEKLVLIGTGAQGEKNAVMMRIANNDHKHVSIKKGDSVVFSSSVIPGNERTIQREFKCKILKGETLF